jgi:hypothetical protein
VKLSPGPDASVDHPRIDARRRPELLVIVTFHGLS